ncbi:hypothetical protein A2U01_0113322, partial [Trifolium medium]|nr:hypothetical protein [Trifolium medium]
MVEFTGEKYGAWGRVEEALWMRFRGRAGSGRTIRMVGSVAGKVVGIGDDGGDSG